MKKSPPSEKMTSEQFRAWRKTLGLKQKEAADQLGLKKRMIQYYETGTRDGKSVKIPKTVRLACYALSQGIEDFDGMSATVAPSPAEADQADPRAEEGLTLVKTDDDQAA